MPAVSAPPRRLSGAFWRALTLLVVAGQLLTASAAWLDFATRERDMGAHVESAGTRQHYVHDEAECAFCALTHLAALPGPLRRAPDDVGPRRAAVAATRSAAVVAEHVRTSRSRAPPVAV